MSKKLLFLLLVLLVAVPSLAADKHHRKDKRIRNRVLETGASCLNILTETEDMELLFDSFTGITKTLNGGIEGPFSGTWAQLWTADAAGSTNRMGYLDNGTWDFAEHNVISAFIKLYSTNDYCRIGLYNGTTATFYLPTFVYSGGNWTEIGGTSDDYFIEDYGNGWYRLGLYVDGDTRGIVGDALRPYIYVARAEAASDGEGCYVWGVNVTQARSSMCVYQGAGSKVYEPLVVKRGSPNDFWFNNQFLDNGTPADNLGDGTEFEQVAGSPHLPYWGDSMMDLDRAWGIVTSSDVGIVLIDQEIATPHYDLNGNIFKNTNEIPDNGIDDDGNDLIDDYEGWDFLSWDNKPYINGDEDDFATAISEGSQHGTQMMSLMASVGNNENWLGAPNRTDKLQGGVGVLWDVPVLACASLGAAGKTANEASFGPFTTESSVATEYANNLRPGKFRVLSESYLGQSEEDGYLAEFYNMVLVAGAGNTNTLGAQATIGNSTDYVTVVGAVLSDGKTGNNAQSGTGAQDGSTSFGASVDFCGYASLEGQYASGGEWVTPPGTYAPMFTAGYVSNAGDVKLNWSGNQAVDAPDGQPGWAIIPTPSLTSGATAQAAGLYSMVLGFFDVSILQAKAMIERGCVTDIYDGRNIDQCNNGDCDGLLGAGRMSAYRTLTLWGAVGDTTLTGDVYVSGDVEFTGTTFLNGVTFHIAPYDLYQQEIDDGVNVTCQSQYDIDYTGFASSSDTEICIYITATTISNSGYTNTFKSNAKYPQEQDWGGIYTEGSGSFLQLGTTVIENTQTGEF